MAPRVGRNFSGIQYESKRDLYHACCDAISEAGYGLAPEIALEIGSSARHVAKWYERNLIGEAGVRQPLWDLVGILDVARRHKTDERALAPLRLLLDRYLVDETQTAEPTAQRGVVTHCSDVMRQVGTLLEAALDAVADEQVTPDEFAIFEDLLQEVKRKEALLRRELEVRMAQGRVS